MGFLDSFSTGLGNIFSSGPVQSALGQFAGLGLNKLADVIGLTPTTSQSPTSFGNISGAPRGFPVGPLGTPVGTFPGAVFSGPTAQQLAAQQAAQRAFALPGGAGNPVQPGFGGSPFRPSFGQPRIPQSIPASQPFGGPNMPAFPVTTQASFPQSPFATGFQQAGSLLPSIARQLPGIIGGLGAGELLDVFQSSGGGTPMFRPTMAGARAQFFRTQNPATGQDTWFRPAGRPLLWSGDLTACKRVKKIARKAARKR